MQKITPFLWFDGKLDQAIAQYTSLFPGSEVLEAHGPEGSLLSARIRLAGQEYLLFNGGPHFKLNEAISLLIDCETQEEIDRLTAGLLEGGGQQQACGWVKDRFGLSWQVVPSVLGKYLYDPDPVKAKRVMTAMMGMKKLEIEGLRRAHEGN
jgi:predicted 3-demethylubiquinone-9 3-methyltransferase (glyoxalase superfamily)